jgi:hypothetical protein
MNLYFFLLLHGFNSKGNNFYGDWKQGLRAIASITLRWLLRLPQQSEWKVQLKNKKHCIDIYIDM